VAARGRGRLRVKLVVDCDIYREGANENESLLFSHYVSFCFCATENIKRTCIKKNWSVCMEEWWKGLRDTHIYWIEGMCHARSPPKLLIVRASGASPTTIKLVSAGIHVSDAC
jgi:hypothetical protein